MEKKLSAWRDVAFDLSWFVVRNWHFCPVAENVTVDDCCGWQCNKQHCARCIRRNADALDTD